MRKVGMGVFRSLIVRLHPCLRMDSDQDGRNQAEIAPETVTLGLPVGVN